MAVTKKVLIFSKYLNTVSGHSWSHVSLWMAGGHFIWNVIRCHKVGLLCWTEGTDYSELVTLPWW